MRYQTRPESVTADAGPHGRLRADFDVNDLNRDGRLTQGEFTRLLGERDPEMSAEECQSAFDEIDTDRDGLIDCAQFLVWWNERL
jgi:Ca2+-binding EF-hand superfamily protein